MVLFNWEIGRRLSIAMGTIGIVISAIIIWTTGEAHSERSTILYFYDGSIHETIIDLAPCKFQHFYHSNFFNKNFACLKFPLMAFI